MSSPADTLDDFRSDAEVETILEAEKILELELALATPAKLCRCEHPATYVEDGEVRCICGSEAR